MKKLSIVSIGLLLSQVAFGQDSSPKGFMADPINHPMLPYYIVFALLAITLILVALVTYYALRLMNMMKEQAEQTRAAKLGLAYKPSPGWWALLSQKLNASVPAEEEKNIELEHTYDGIKELDNHLPPWWKWLFYGTIGWAVIYIIVFHFTSTLPLSGEEYENELAVAAQQAEKIRAMNPQAAIDENSLVYTPDPAIIEKGKAVFNNNPCGSCHRADGGGNTIGPNLTDEYWIHGGDVKNVFNTIKNGAVDKGMPAWGGAMSPQDVRDLTFYILSLQGTNPPDAKGPQGDIFKQTIKQDSTNARASL